MRIVLIILAAGVFSTSCDSASSEPDPDSRAAPEDTAVTDSEQRRSTDSEQSNDTNSAIDTDSLSDSAVQDVSDDAVADANTDSAQVGDICQPECQDKECGPDGCGSLCGFCIKGEMCTNTFQCAPECEPQCDNKFCGSDNCGGSCGTCETGFACGDDGKCYNVACTPDCDGKVCGPDGCGLTCGECVNNDICEKGQCVTGPCSGIPDNGKCDGETAYLCVEGDAQITDCSSLDNQTCDWNPSLGHYGCVDKVACVPDCTNKQCGEDGCGGQCGACPTGWPCETGACVITAGGACGYVTATGLCKDNVLWYCNAKKLFTMDCTATESTCGFDATAQKNQCK